VVTRRDGRVAACYRDTHWSQDLRTADLLAAYPQSRKPGATVPSNNEGKRNTTISLIVTNQKLSPSELQRLATHVHSSMSRAITPFATEFDGDVLYAVSTEELDPAKSSAALPSLDIDVAGAELMWDAILSAVPEQPGFPQISRKLKLSASDTQAYTGQYTFSPFVALRVTTDQNKLFAQATGPRPLYGIGREAPVELVPVSNTDFTVQGRYPLVLHFEPGRVVVNPGHWAQVGLK
jgi:hypothetical protein